MNAKVVVDLTPGGGILAAACRSKGVTYTGLVRNFAIHQRLTNSELFADFVDQQDDPLAEAAIASVDMQL